MNISKLNKPFVAQTILTAAQLNSVTDTIDEIINLLSSIDNNGGGVTDEQIQKKINDAKAEINVTISKLQNDLGGVLQWIDQLEIPEGGFTYKDENTYIESIKNNCTQLLLTLNLLTKSVNPDTGEEETHPTVTLGLIQKLQSDTSALTNSVATLQASYDGISNSVGLIANHFDENGNPKYDGAQIIAAINDNGNSEVAISADKVTINGSTTITQDITALQGNFSSLTSGNGTFTGNVKAKEFEVIDGSNNPTIVFTTMSDEYRGAGYENLNSSSIQNGEPIGLIYDPTTHKPKYFFDFAPVANSGGTTNTLKRYLLSNSGITEISSYYYNTTPPYYSDQAGTSLATSNTTTYQYLGTVNVFARHTNSGQSAHQDTFIVTADKYVGYTYNSQGYPVATGNVYYRVTGVDNSDYWLSLPNEKTIITNPNVNIKTGFNGTSLANTSQGVQFENVSEVESVSLWVFDTVDALVNLSGKTITTWQPTQYYITTSETYA